MTAVRASLLGLSALLAALLMALVWIPADVDTGVLERARRQVMLGDSFAPYAAVAVLALGGLLVLAEGWTGRGEGPRPFTPELSPNPPVPASPQHRAIFVLALLAALIGAGITVRWAGPAAVSLANMAGADLPEYRLLRDTLPWSALGFLLAGTGLVAGSIATFEHRMSWRALGLGLAVAVTLWGIFDLPFEDMMLPPNADL